MSTVKPIEQFKRDGFYIARKLIDTEEIISVRESLRKSFSDQLIHLGGAELSDDMLTSMRLLHDRDIERYKKLVGALWRKLDVYNIMHHSNILKLLTDDFGWGGGVFVPGGQVVHIMAHELKIPGGYFGLIPHQDFPSVQGSLDGVVVWLPLVKVDRDNFPLELIPGIHKRGLLPMLDEGNMSWEIRPDQYQEKDFIPVEVDVGDVIFLSMFTVHRSSINGTQGRYRLSLSTRFDNANEATFIDRCYPTAYERNVHRAQYFPGFPTLEQVDATFKVS